MIPGEIIVGSGPVELNPGRAVTVTRVVNTGDRPIQVGSHYHLSAANPALDFDRQAAWGMRLAIAAGTSVRFEPGVGRDVELVPFAGRREIPGLRNELAGPLDSADSGPASGPASGHEELRRG